MDRNLILAGVGGQGILTIARGISIAALKRGLNIKQAEVHGMSQRGGDVQSHLRIADEPLSSDLIPAGQAHMIVAVEPLEALRYVQYLRPDGVVIAATNAFVNIGNYPPIEQVLERIGGLPRHVLLDADGLAGGAGSARAANIVMLGAASLFLGLERKELEDAVAEIFAEKGPKVLETNRRAFLIGRHAGQAYLDALEHGGTSRSVRHWLETIPPEQFVAPVDASGAFQTAEPEDRLSGAEAQAFESALLRVYEQGRKRLYEHEVYTLVELVGAISPPRHVFVPRGEMIAEETLAQFPGDKVVLKIVSPDIAHKTEARGVVFVPKGSEAVKQEIERLVGRHREGESVTGVLVVEFVEDTQSGFGKELFVGVRATREFGPVIAAGLGGVDTEYLAANMRPNIAVAKALATDTSAEEFLERFKSTAAYNVLSGQARGHERIVSDAELLRCFRAFISIARRFCIDRGAAGPDIAELEVNPFAFRNQRLIPLDGRGRLGPAAKAPPARPIEKVRRLLEPRAIALLGVSSKAMNFGRIILNNIKDCGFPREHLYVIKEDADQVDEVRCVPTIAALPEPVDLLVIAAPATHMLEVVQQVVDSGKVQSAIMIPGGLGETEGTEDILARVRLVILAGRERPDGGPVFLGPNCMGVQSRPGRYDTFFIPAAKLDPRWSAPPRRAALVSQSGAFIVSRLSNLELLDPALSVSIGNQIDLTLSDVLQAVGERPDIAAIGVYAEGFANMDGLALLRTVRSISDAGKSVIFYKAGRTSSGASAAAGHTASVAGDYDVCQAAADAAGAIVVDTFKEFEELLELATALHDKSARGVRIAAMSNAGFETVGMADSIAGTRYEVELAKLSDETRQQLRRILARSKLDSLVNVRNPLDLTPMATEEAYEQAARLLLESDEVDALVMSAVPLTPSLLTTPAELKKPGSLAERLPRLFAASPKPLVFVVDSGPLYDALAHAVRAAGVPVFRSADQAVRALGRYLCRRLGHPAEPVAAATATRAGSPAPVQA